MIFEKKLFFLSDQRKKMKIYQKKSTFKKFGEISLLWINILILDRLI